MWKVDESGEFAFSDATNSNQLVLFERKPNFSALERSVLQRFAGKTVSLADIEEFVLADTPFRETHYKTQVLKQLEVRNPPGIEVLGGRSGRRRGTFADATMMIRFT